MAPSPQPIVTSARLTWIGLGAIFLAYVVRFGYGYAYSDQDDVLPFVMALDNGALFASDWFVQEQLTALNVRTYVAYGLWGLSQLVSLEWTIGLLYVASFGLLANGLYRIYLTTSRHQVVSLGAVFVALVLTPQWTLGGNDLAHSMFVPSMLAWGIVLHGIHAALHRRWAASGFLVGLAVLVQALVGLQVALVLGALLALAGAARKLRWRPLIVFSGSMLVVGSPMLIPLVAQVLTAAPLAESAPSIRTILAEYRAPHHYLVTAFPLRAWLRFGVLLSLGVGSAAWLAYQVPRTPYLRAALLTLAIISVVLMGAVMFTLIWPSTFVLKLQLFKLTVLAKVVLIGVLAGGMSRVVPVLDERPWIARGTIETVGLTVLIGCAGLLGLRAEDTPWNPRMGSTPDEQAVMAWALSESDEEALFIIPPTWSGFRSQAMRSAVVTIKGFPFTDAAMVEWYNRMAALVSKVPDTGSALSTVSESGYASRSARALEAAAATYSATHIVTHLDTLSASWMPAASFGTWYVHERREVLP